MFHWGGATTNAALAAGVTMWVAVWWATEAVPIPITSLLPLVLFPLLEIENIQQVTKSYTSPAIYLLIGGFILALGLQRWGLHRRIALFILQSLGSTPTRIVLVFMLVTAFLSMWISNTATTLMMLPIATSVALIISNEKNKRKNDFTVVLLLSVAYSASIGGFGTLVGTPPNILMAGFMKDHYGITIDFVDWMLFGIPLVLILLPTAWFVLSFIVFPIHKIDIDNNLLKKTISEQYEGLGDISLAEKRMSLVFVAVVILWISKKWLIAVTGLEGISDTGIAITGAILLFVIPASKGKPLMDWDYAKQLPWDVVLLYGGGMALASVITSSGLASSIGNHMFGMGDWHLLALVFAITLIVLLLTELTNNSATVATFMPILGGLSVATNYPPLQLAVPAVLAANCAFMLPVATPPNAVVYGSGKVTIAEMAKGGVLINTLCLLLIPLACYFLLPLIF
ncbi:SLC13 family permease [Paraglaciecola arctica]|uniref:SLC13 family permease n=1 Tax=Paraglaciecola arctica TaxID=1128911 RepID=UPI001C06E982|nr:DASS family sodium-coupled anion symporter [Paraglaciecola arctica]MBU3004253.1 DASS family sodium-coupled anion symporter [Paraglaciecola arctica]